ncbi:GNAT family N-acetyltransferase [Sulfitobacter aestuariivivens]|uniref:GNAT family N-acetyltransferase n=1 Tax=Sulfitobacter aestuariivivens TaxID=2766981 RepID=A0A927D7M9_9RHOB|nr:GNAT family N-acetyltransferase [Sulfitobacter aestuariivivens]MBD3665916.1 GNAT family N-acetyltransferase [Sulfitobacter aestuariivivens]
MDALTLQTVSAPDAEIAALLQAHFDLMRSTSPAESCHVMAPESVFDEADVVLAARRAGLLLGIGALKAIGPNLAELKSMHTTKAARGQGVGAYLLTALMEAARQMGMQHISLETGTDPLFAPARALYTRHGFETCAPFGDYVDDPLSTFMTRRL